MNTKEKAAPNSGEAQAVTESRVRSRFYRKSVPTHTVGESLTKQSGAADADINSIMAKYVKTGFLPLTRREPMFADVSDVGDYHQALNKVIHAQQTFDSLPARIREACGNDPAELVDLVMNPERLEEAVSLGVLSKGPPETPAARGPAPAPPSTAASPGPAVVPGGDVGPGPGTGGGPSAPGAPGAS